MTSILLPAVSVVIPCYRQGHFLPLAIDSVLRQSYSNVEPIVVNDGSDDDTEQVALQYGDRIRYVAKPNGGLSSARNAGIAAATGKYLLFLDADDMLHPDAVRRLVEAAGEGNDRIVVMGFRNFQDDPLADGQPDQSAAQDALGLASLIHYNPAPCHSYLSSVDAVREVGEFEETLSACEDWDLWIRLLLAGAEVVTVPEVGAYYRRLPGSMSGDMARMLEARIQVLLRAHRAILQCPELISGLGDELVDAEQRMLRRLLAKRTHGQLVPSLVVSMRELRDHGFPTEPKSRWPKRMLDALLGYRAEIVAVHWLRVFRPAEFAQYRSGFH